MSKLEKALKDWVSHGLISYDQAKLIQDHESKKPESSWVLSGLLILGAVIIGIGVISLIAANWNEIPDLLKLASDFALLIGMAYWSVHAWENKKHIVFEVVLLFFIILCLASIGLISQIYHTGGKLYQALLLWSFITFAASLCARNIFVPLMWTGGFLTAVVYAALDSLVLRGIFLENYQAVFMMVPLLCASLTIISKSFAGESASTRAFRSWTLLGGIVAISVAETHVIFKSKDIIAVTPYIPGYLLAAFSAFGIAQSIEYKKIQKIILLAVLALFLAPFHLPMLFVKSSVVYAIFTILTLGLMSIFLASIKERRLFQWFLFLVGWRFLGLYFQALGGLATTGIGLILSGGLVIGMTVLWNKYRTTIALWAERRLQ